ncbi:MAG: DNA/RNA nuclease SfsA, partial [Pseudomonadota bacterium]
EGPDGATKVGINTHHPNKIAEEAIQAGIIDGLTPDLPLRREVKYGEEKSRIDILLEGPQKTWVEVKNCHLLRREDGVTEFPDCVTARGLKHLRELMGMVAAGDRAVLLFIIQREDTTGFAPADDLDPAYGKGLREAAAAGVEILAYDCALSVDQISARKSVPVLL